ncbi:MAG: LON peptidase substrate-binding domain-containing protein [Alphaproteobacteria bacterium]|nr:LON peptidase substrate-binding domain-containing protein [Alphaproteobacteria bacterium]
MLEDNLPEIVPIFPLSGALLLPRGVLPLNIFEPRYLNMVHDAMANDRTIGMVQPLKNDDKSQRPAVYQTGCLGRITAFNETEDDRFLIMLTGVNRFHIARELPDQNGYRRIVPDYSDFSEDQVPETGNQIDRNRLLDVLHLFLQQNAIEVEWKAVTALPDEQLIVSLAMTCPFKPNEKQALLECASLAERSQVLTALLEMALLSPGTDDSVRPN